MTRIQLLLKRLRQQRAALKAKHATNMRQRNELLLKDIRIDELNKRVAFLESVFVVRVTRQYDREDGEFFRCEYGITRQAFMDLRCEIAPVVQHIAARLYQQMKECLK